MPVSPDLAEYKEMILWFDLSTIMFFLLALLFCVGYVVKIIIEKKKMFNTQSLSFLSWLVGFFVLLLFVFLVLGSNGLSSLIKNEYFYLATLSLFGVMVGSCSLWIFRFIARLSGLKLGGLNRLFLLSFASPVLFLGLGVFEYVIGFIILAFLICLVVFIMSLAQNWLEKKGGQ